MLSFYLKCDKILLKSLANLQKYQNERLRDKIILKTLILFPLKKQEILKDHLEIQSQKRFSQDVFWLLMTNFQAKNDHIDDYIQSLGRKYINYSAFFYRKTELIEG